MMLRLPSMRATPGSYSWTIRSTFKWNMRLFFFSHQLLPLILLSLMAIYFNLWWGLRDVCDAVFASIYIYWVERPKYVFAWMSGKMENLFDGGRSWPLASLCRGLFLETIEAVVGVFGLLDCVKKANNAAFSCSKKTVSPVHTWDFCEKWWQFWA